MPTIPSNSIFFFQNHSFYFGIEWYTWYTIKKSLTLISKFLPCPNVSSWNNFNFSKQINKKSHNLISNKSINTAFRTRSVHVGGKRQQIFIMMSRADLMVERWIVWPCDESNLMGRLFWKVWKKIRFRTFCSVLFFCVWKKTYIRPSSIVINCFTVLQTKR